MSCRICGKPVVLVPSAKERAKKYGGTPAFYTSLFPDHAACVVTKRSQESIDLMRRIRNNGNSEK